MTVHQYGKGRAYVVGFYPGLEYSATIRDGQPDMSRDLDAARRSFIAAPAPTGDPAGGRAISTGRRGCVVMPRNAALGERAVVLMNWAYRLTGSPIRANSRPDRR